MTEYKQAATCMFLSAIPYLYTKFYTYGIGEITICIVTAIIIIAMYFHWGYDVRRNKWYTRACYAIIVLGFIFNIYSTVEIFMFFLRSYNDICKLASILCECCILSTFTVLPFLYLVYGIFAIFEEDIIINRNKYTIVFTHIVLLIAHAYVYSYVTNSFLQALLLLILFYTFLGCILSAFAGKHVNKQYFYLKIIACAFYLINFAYWMSLIKNQKLITAYFI